MKDDSLDKLKKLCNNDEVFMREMIEIFIRTSKESLEKIDENLKLGDLENVGNYAHKLKSSIQIIADSSLHSLVKSIEINAKSGDINKALKQEISELSKRLETLNSSLKDYLA